MPDSKNPILAAFFRNIGLADELGSGVRRLFKYVPFYSNAQPTMHEADVFRITVPLDDLYSYDMEILQKMENNKDKQARRYSVSESDTAENKRATNTVTDTVKKLILAFVQKNEMGSAELLNRFGLSNRSDFHTRYLRPAISEGYLERTQPDSPHSPTQKYRLTTKGHAVMKELNF